MEKVNLFTIMAFLVSILVFLLCPLRAASQTLQTRTSSNHGQTANDHGFLKDKDYLWSYFETPLGDGVGPIGPSHWKDLRIEDNQCGGGGQINGFGQSPALIPLTMVLFDACDTDLNGYETFDGDCKWSDVDYLILKGSLALKAKTDAHGEPICSLGKWKIPQNKDKVYEATELHLKRGSEHAVEGMSGHFTMQVFHQEIDGVTKAALNMLFIWNHEVDLNPEGPSPKDDLVEMLLKGWRKKYWETFYYCNENENGSGIFNVNTVLKAQQNSFICEDLDSLDGSKMWISDTEVPEDPEDTLIPNLAFIKNKTLFEGDYNMYTYEGSLTTPPCTENVYWNLFGGLQLISSFQYSELTTLLLCFREESSCNFASIASEFGRTVRPPQPLHNRQFVKRCLQYNGTDSEHELFVADEVEKYEKHEETEPYYALLFPWFVVVLGLCVFYLLTRYVHAIPYTAVMFLLGTAMGVSSAGFEEGKQLTDSIMMWETINGELLLLAFLPGLLFKDAYCLDVHLFQKSFGQILIMAFPMVLAGTVLTALIPYYILPYDWNFNLCMTFGAILSATDPVAVAALLTELGAPPRLKTHIAGESLLNDGSAIVFFTIFKMLYLNEEGLHGGEDIGIGMGFYKFAIMSVGAALLGVAFGIGLIISLYLLNRRFNGEEKVVQVTATLGVAYLSYYVGEAILHLSGVITVVFCGLVTKAFAKSLIIDHVLMDNFWNMLEFILNTVLFCLGGVIWGSVIISNPDHPHTFGGKDWGYLFVVYVLIFIIRYILFLMFYPIIVRIGLKSTWKEAFFQCFGGLRGALGITLAAFINNEVARQTVTIDPRRIPTLELFGIIGGITLLTLVINGSLSGPLLKRLELNRATKQRMDILANYDISLRKTIINSLVKLLGEAYYKSIDFEIVSQCVPQLNKLTYMDIRTAIRRVKYTTPSHLYQAPDLSVFDKLISKEQARKLKAVSKLKLFERIQSDTVMVMAGAMPDELGDEQTISNEELKEMRLVYVELLLRAYDELMICGHIDVRDSLVVYVIQSSIALMEDEVSNGMPMNDWQACRKYNTMFKKYQKTATKIHLATAFIQAHENASKVFKYQVHQDGFLTSVERKVLDESSIQISLAYEELYQNDPIKLRKHLSHQLSAVLLNQAGIYIASMVDAGILKDEEGEHYFEHLEKDIANIKKIRLPAKQVGRGTFLKCVEADTNTLQIIRSKYSQDHDSHNEDEDKYEVQPKPVAQQQNYYDSDSEDINDNTMNHQRDVQFAEIARP